MIANMWPVSGFSMEPFLTWHCWKGVIVKQVSSLAKHRTLTLLSTTSTFVVTGNSNGCKCVATYKTCLRVLAAALSTCDMCSRCTFAYLQNNCHWSKWWSLTGSGVSNPCLQRLVNSPIQKPPGLFSCTMRSPNSFDMNFVKSPLRHSLACHLLTISC